MPNDQICFVCCPQQENGHRPDHKLRQRVEEVPVHVPHSPQPRAPQGQEGGRRGRLLRKEPRLRKANNEKVLKWCS